jgi:hypothetical protein
MKQIAKIALGVVLGFVLLIGGCSLLFTAGSNDKVNIKQEQQKEKPAIEGKSEPEEDSDAELGSINNDITWKQYQFSKDDYKIALYNDDYMALITGVKTVGHEVRFTYTFFNESGDDSTPGFVLNASLYQDGINNDDIEFDHKHGDEYTSIRSGYSIDNCYEYVSFDPNKSKNVEIDLGLLWSTDCTLIYNVDTEEFSIK